jgi:hypothetical protein
LFLLPNRLEPAMTNSLRPLFAAVLLVWAVGGGVAYGQLDPNGLEQDERLKVFHASVADFKITVAKDGEPLTLRDKPLMRFTNDIGGVLDGAVMMWTSGQRPMVAAQVFVTGDGVWLHEFQSFADRPLKLTSEGKTLWQPKKAGGKWQDFADAPAVEQTRAGRFKQMKELADQFSISEDFRVRVGDKDTSRYELRLLTAPLYRYEESDDGIDGAVFAFVHGTDPEALLTIELQNNGGRSTSRFNFAALTCWAMQAKHGDEQVWSVPEMYGKSAQDQPYHLWVFKPDASVLKK